MKLRIQNRPLAGEITVPPSKSVAQRALVCAYLAGGGRVSNLGESRDVEAMRRCLSALEAGEPMNAGESAAAMRLLIPLCVLRGGGRFLCGPGLLARPMPEYPSCIRIRRLEDGYEALGSLPPGEYELDAGYSSQAVSGMLLALPLAGESVLRLRGEAVSRPYPLLTMAVMDRFGVKADFDGSRYAVPGGQRYLPRDMAVEGDWSYAANFTAANAMGGRVTLWGLDPDSPQGDRRMEALMEQAEPDLRDTPDLLPALMVYACFKSSDTRFSGISRLRHKESDRPKVMARALSGLGAQIVQKGDTLTVRGRGGLRGGAAHAFGDHRVAMALSIAACMCEEPVELSGCEAVAKSAPGFFEDIRRLGGI